MKTLTTTQINQIEDFLISQYNIKYQDTRDEVLDHIACEVEELMSEGAYFSEALKLTIAKWHSQLKPSLLIMKKTPRLIANKMLNENIKHLGLIAITSILIGLALHYFIANYISNTLISFTLLAINILMVGMIKYKRNLRPSFKSDIYKELLVVLAWFSFFLIDVMALGYYTIAHTSALAYVSIFVLCVALFLTSWTAFFIHKLNNEYHKVIPLIK